MQIAFPLCDYVDALQLGSMYNGAGFWLERDPDTVLGADFAFVRKEREIRTHHFYPGRPDLVVEVISSFNDTDAELADKVAEWLRARTPAVIVADTRRSTVHVHRSSGIERVQDILTVPDVVPGWQLALSEIFA